MGIDIHCGADVRMAKQFLDIFRCGTGGEEVAGVGVAQDMKMETAEFIVKFSYRTTHY